MGETKAGFINKKKKKKFKSKREVRNQKHTKGRHKERQTKTGLKRRDRLMP